MLCFDCPRFGTFSNYIIKAVYFGSFTHLITSFNSYFNIGSYFLKDFKQQATKEFVCYHIIYWWRCLIRSCENTSPFSYEFSWDWHWRKIFLQKIHSSTLKLQLIDINWMAARYLHRRKTYKQTKFPIELNDNCRHLPTRILTCSSSE